MKLFLTTLVLGALTVGQAAAATMLHRHAPMAPAKHNHAARHAEMMEAQVRKRDLAKRSTSLLAALDVDKVLGLGLKTVGINPTSNNGHAWIGSDGQWTNEFINQSGEDIVLVVWGPAGSWVNAIQPQITISIPANGSQVLSFPSGASGAWAPIYKETKLVNGQISETWGEFTFGQWGVVDVSREVNMNGRNMAIHGPKCVTDMSTCVFVCPAGQSVCTYGYILQNCENGSQPGANYGTYAGSPSGGCGGMGDSAHLKTYLG